MNRRAWWRARLHVENPRSAPLGERRVHRKLRRMVETERWIERVRLGRSGRTRARTAALDRWLVVVATLVVAIALAAALAR